MEQDQRSDTANEISTGGVRLNLKKAVRNFDLGYASGDLTPPGGAGGWDILLNNTQNFYLEVFEMNETIHDKLIQHYLNIVAADSRKSVLLLKTLSVLVDGGPRLDELKQVLDKVDDIGMMRAGEFRLNYDNGGGDDPLARAIARISK